MIIQCIIGQTTYMTLACPPVVTVHHPAEVPALASSSYQWTYQSAGKEHGARKELSGNTMAIYYIYYIYIDMLSIYYTHYIHYIYYIYYLYYLYYIAIRVGKIIYGYIMWRRSKWDVNGNINHPIPIRVTHPRVSMVDVEDETTYDWG